MTIVGRTIPEVSNKWSYVTVTNGQKPLDLRKQENETKLKERMNKKGKWENWVGTVGGRIKKMKERMKEVETDPDTALNSFFVKHLLENSRAQVQADPGICHDISSEYRNEGHC